MALICERRCQPCVATMPSVQSRPTTRRSPSHLRESSSRSSAVTAAVPMTTQWTPMPATRARFVGAADAAAVLHRDVEGLDDALHDGEVDELAGARGVQVDDVEGLRALVLPEPRQRDRVVAEHGDVVEVAAPQAHGLAALDVDGREDDHEARTSCLARSTKLASRRRPTTELFSGWNCIAHTVIAGDGGDHRAAVVGRWRRRWTGRRAARRTSARNTRRPGRAARGPCPPRPPSTRARSSRCAAP